MAILKQIVLQAESLFQNFVKDWQYVDSILNAHLNEFYAWIIGLILLYNCSLVEVVFHYSLFETLVVVDLVFYLLGCSSKMTLIFGHKFALLKETTIQNSLKDRLPPR